MFLFVLAALLASVTPLTALAEDDERPVPPDDLMWQIHFYITCEDGGDAVLYSVQNVMHGQLAVAPGYPERYGFRFAGWHTVPDGLRPFFRFDLPITRDFTLYAMWERSFTPSKTPIHVSYFTGYGNYIRPHANVTRAEAATMFFRLIEDDYRDVFWMEMNPFPDVTAEDWFNIPVSTMRNTGLLSGGPDGNFNPDELITRAEFTALVVRFAGLSDQRYYNPNRFSDIWGHWAANVINIAAQNGWVNGPGDGTFRPNNTITRAEVAAILNQMLGRLPECAETDLHPDMTIWADSRREHYEYEIDLPRPIVNPNLTFNGELVPRAVTNGIVLHHLDSLGNVHSVHNWHLQQGWFGIGYNFLVMQNGTIYKGRGMEAVGAHAQGHNTRTVGIAAQGRYHTLDTHMPNAQFDSIIWLMRYIQNIYGQLTIYGHGDLNATACPGRHFPMAELRRMEFRDPSNVTRGYGIREPWFFLHMQEASHCHIHEMKECGIHERWVELLPPRDWGELQRPRGGYEIDESLIPQQYDMLPPVDAGGERERYYTYVAATPTTLTV